MHGPARLHGATALTLICAIDHVLPPRAVAALRAQVIGARVRDSRTHWYAFDAPARSLFEQVIQHLRRVVPAGHEFVGAEWWFRATPTDTGFPFHFDRDEAIRDSIVSPDLASILYLSHAGGPTVIVNATPTRRAAPTAGIAIPPRPGRLGMFPGALLHGVLPAAPSRWPRVTMLVNWWRHVPRMERARALRGGVLASGHWRVGAERVATLEPIDPERILARAAWRDVITGQTTYR